MKTTTYINSLADVALVKASGATEAILGTKELSRYGLIPLAELADILVACEKANLKAMLEWDILMTEDVFKEKIKLLAPIDWSKVAAIRVQDLGAAEFIFQNYPELKIQLNLETGNHNLESLKGHVAYFKERLARIILSVELTKVQLKEYCHYLNEQGVESELLVFGKLLLYYSPRHLLSPNFTNQSIESNAIYAKGRSEESPHKGFFIIDNEHGTFMFHPKTFSLREFEPELASFNLSYKREDLRFKAHHEQDNAEIIRGFYLSNKTDVLFPKLKNKNLVRNDYNYVGEVVDVIKDKSIAIKIKNKKLALKLGDELVLKCPEKNDQKVKISWMKDVALRDLSSIQGEQIFIMNFMKKVVPRSQIYLSE